MNEVMLPSIRPAIFGNAIIATLANIGDKCLIRYNLAHIMLFAAKMTHALSLSLLLIPNQKHYQSMGIHSIPTLILSARFKRKSNIAT